MIFASYDEFLKWVYDPATKIADEDGTWSRLNVKMYIEIEGDYCTYSSVIDCLIAYEAG